MSPFGVDKTTTQWAGRSGTTVFTVYDYKAHQAPGPDEEYRWHIGGHKGDAVSLIGHLLNKPTETLR